MKKDKELNNILDECLERILVNGETIEQCLERYPEYAAELKPLLLTATATNEAIVDVTPSPEFKARARYQLRAEMAGSDVKKKRFFLAWQPRWAVAVFTAILVLLLGGGTVLAADSENTIPGNPLYAVKLATENVRLALTSSDATKAELYATLVDRRTSEIERLMERGKTELARRTVARLKSHLASIYSLSPDSQTVIGPEITEDEPSVKPDVAVQDIATAVTAAERTRLQVLLGRYIVSHPDEIRTMVEEAAPSVKPALTRVIVASVNSYVDSCQKALRESKQSQNGEKSNTSNGTPNNSNQQTGETDKGPGTSNQQSDGSDTGPGTSNQQSGESDMEPGTSNQQSGESDMGPGTSNQQSGTLNQQSGASSLAPVSSALPASITR
jgi:hypothetical protein